MTIVTGFLGAVLGSALTGFVSWQVFKNQISQNRFDAFLSIWHGVQSSNAEKIADKNVREEFENIVYGEPLNDLALSYNLIFDSINNAQFIYYAIQTNRVDTEFGMELFREKIRLLKGHADLVEYLIRNRGYSDNFITFFTKEFSALAPVLLPDPEIIKMASAKLQ